MIDDYQLRKDIDLITKTAQNINARIGNNNDETGNIDGLDIVIDWSLEYDGYSTISVNLITGGN